VKSIRSIGVASVGEMVSTSSTGVFSIGVASVGEMVSTSSTGVFSTGVFSIGVASVGGGGS